MELASEHPICLSAVEKHFPKMPRPAVTDVTAEMAAGVVTGLVGPDGAGKTTLMRLIAGLLKPTAGTIRVHGFDPAAHGPELREVIGYMPQKFGLYEDLSVIENLNLHADLRGLIGARRAEVFDRLLAFTSLAPFTTRLAGKLSGGMKQKLGLACALLGQPRVLLLDEPGVGVDPISRRELWKMVKELVGQGMAVVWSTAYLDEAELCENVLLLSEGRMLFAGPPAELKQRVQGRCWRICGLNGNRRALLTQALRSPGVQDGVIQGHAIRLVTRAGSAPPDPGQLRAGPRAHLEPDTPRFEDGFIDILGGGPGGDSPLASTRPPSQQTHDEVVQAENLTRKFGEFTAADRVSFSVRRGEIFGLLGPNGAGKSTVFRMMCGLLPPTSGSARVAGIDLRTSASQARERLGYMAQKFSLYGNLTVRQNLEFFSGAYGLRGSKRNEAVTKMVEVFKFDPFLNSSSETLPLGLKQRLALACALMHQPEILFLDEPTSGVDPVSRREFWTHINGLVERGVTAVVTTHFMDEAEYCDRIALVFQGRIIASGSPDDLKALAIDDTRPDPTMEDAFIHLVQTSTAAQTPS
jgi:ABC-2 type transport system ATP-binding protein